MFKRIPTFWLIGAVLSGLILPDQVRADVVPAKVDAFLAENCFECHDDQTAKGGLNLIDLKFDLNDPDLFDHWKDVFLRAESGEMPPAKKERPDPAALKNFLSALEPPLLSADQARVKADGRTKVRRLTRREYEMTIHKDVIWGTLRSGSCSSDEPLLFPIGLVEATGEKKDLTFEAWIQKRHMLELRPNDSTIERPKLSTKGGTIDYKGSDLLKDWVPGIALSGIEMTRIYPHGANQEVRKALLGKIVKKQVETATPEESPKLVTEAVRHFANLAFRRPITDGIAEPYVTLALNSLKEKDGTIPQALATAYRAILCSPRFLTFYEAPGHLDQHAVAARLSYMLWNSMPDDVLRDLADEGKLKDQVVQEQMFRMLKDPKSARFVESFTDQWLKLNQINFTTPDVKRFKTFDTVVQESMLAETRSFFSELIQGNQSVTNLIQSDFAMLNERLARFYGLEEVDLKPGGGLQKVSLNGDPRGGLVTQGAILKVTADGTSTSPIVRGVFVGERLLGMEIPPPPPGIPAVEPDIRGAVSIRDQFDKHRNNESCAACHNKIDPAGFALENFDPVGNWRNRYGTKKDSAKVDPSGMTPSGEAFQDVKTWKEIYLKKPDLLVEAFARHVLTYATGSPPAFSDREALQKIVQGSREKDYGMRSILHHIVASEPFRTK